MKRIPLVVVLLVASTSSAAQSLKLTTADGGSVITKLAYNIEVNKGSSLRRSWISVNDPTCPAQLSNAGIITRYESGTRSSSGDYVYRAAGSLSASEALGAFNLRFILFDTFGDHIETLSASQVTDLQSGAMFDLSNVGTWRASESDVSAYLTAFIFVANVRTIDGRVWQYNSKSLSDEIAKIKLRVTSADLEPKK